MWDFYPAFLWPFGFSFLVWQISKEEHEEEHEEDQEIHPYALLNL